MMKLIEEHSLAGFSAKASILGSKCREKLQSLIGAIVWIRVLLHEFCLA